MIDNSPINQSVIFLKDLVRDYLEQTTYPIDGFDWSPENFVSTKPSIYHSLRLDADTSQSGERREKPAIGRNLANEENTQFRDTAANQELPLEINGEPLSGRHVYQSSLYSANPSLEPQSGKLRDRDTGRIMIDYPDIPTSLKRNWGTEDRFRPLNLHGFTGNAPTPQRFTGKNFQPEGIIYGDVDENDIHRINRKPFTLDRLNQVARTLVPWNKTLDVNNLKHHNLELAQDIMEAGIPPILLESNIDTKGKVHPMPVRLDNEFDLVESHDPFTQWDKNNLNRTDTQGLEEFKLSEPMEIAMRLLKRELHPGENQYKHRYKMPNRDNVHPEWYDWIQETLDNPAEYEGIADDFQQPDINHLAGATSREDFFERLYDLHNFQVDDVQPPFDDIEGKYRDFTDIPFNEETGFTRSEPMQIAMRLLKERVSPEAKRHKLEYDKKYESSPERVKYREELNRERRRRHIMGQGGPDMSHTKDHTIVPESPHTNRARHFKDKGTLL